jgi:hypothetical protein
MADEQVFLQGLIKIRRITASPVPAPEFGNNVSMRWGARFFIISPSFLIQQPSETAPPEQRTFLGFSSIQKIRWPTSDEVKKGFSLSNSLRKMVMGSEAGGELKDRELDSSANTSGGSSVRGCCFVGGGIVEVF